MDRSPKPDLELVNRAAPEELSPNGVSETALRQVHQYRSASERRAEGRALRDDVPREAHGGWKPAKGRRQPVELLLETNQGRMPQLVPIRHGRMVQSPFAFYRGSAGLMAADLADTPRSGLRVQACGDAHLMNFGGFATPERNFIFDINDLDETLPAPWEWDLKRLAASIVIAGRHIELSESDCTRAVAATVRSYRKHMADYAFMKALDVWYERIDIADFVKEFPDNEIRRRAEERIEKTRARSAVEYDFPKLAVHHGSLPKIKDNPPLIFHPSKEEAPGYESGYAEAIALYRDSLPEQVQILFDRFYFRDLAIKVVGVGSVGTMCAVGLFMAEDNDPLFLQVKQANASVLEPYAGKSLHPNHGQRVIAGQRLMQSASDIFLGWTRSKDGSRDFYIRQLRDMKISVIIEGWDVDMLRTYGRLCGRALAHAHARSGDAAMISGYMGSSGIFDDAICEFATDYADQNERDYRAFVMAVREGQVQADVES
jgi:uncharacterized protein (DUF2252 family)